MTNFYVPSPFLRLSARTRGNYFFGDSISPFPLLASWQKFMNGPWMSTAMPYASFSEHGLSGQGADGGHSMTTPSLFSLSRS